LLLNLTGFAGTFPVSRSGLTLDCGNPAPLWFSVPFFVLYPLFRIYPESKAAQGRRTPKIAAQS